LTTRYKQNFQTVNTTLPIISRHHWNSTQLPEDWQTLILTAGVGAQNKKWHGSAFIGKNRLGQVLFYGCQSLRTTNITTTRLIAIREASLVASR
jgi:hypothetical protein